MNTRESKKEKTLDQSNLCKCVERKKIPLGTFRSECLRKWNACCRDTGGKEELRTKGTERGFLAGTFSPPHPPPPPPPPPTDAFNLHFFYSPDFSVFMAAASLAQRLSARIYSHGAVTSIFQGSSQVRGRLGDVPAEGTTGEPTRRGATAAFCFQQCWRSLLHLIP